MNIILASIGDQKTIENNARIVASSGLTTRADGKSVIDVFNKRIVYANNLKIVRNILESGHTSVIDHLYFCFAVSNVSLLLEQMVIQ